MVNAQKWFDKNYPKSKREKITELDISEKENAPNNKKLIGTLKLEGFNSLKKLNCAGNLLVSLEIKDLPHFTSLDCSHNKITSLNIVNCPKFESLIAFDNLLVDLTFLDNFDPKKLTVLGLGDNNLLSQDLSIFSEFTNLTKLTVHSVRENKVQQGIYNRFHGSLEPLKNFTKLEHLDISGTDIDSGLEYLPLNKLGFFLCGNEARPEAKVVKIYAVCGNNNHLETLQKKTLGFDKGKLQKYQTDF
jgi:Leucine-rich repeat (LRR) protein